MTPQTPSNLLTSAEQAFNQPRCQVPVLIPLTSDSNSASIASEIPLDLFPKYEAFFVN